jgi:hypothetical protein
LRNGFVFSIYLLLLSNDVTLDRDRGWNSKCGAVFVGGVCDGQTDSRYSKSDWERLTELIYPEERRHEFTPEPWGAV